MHKWAGSEAAGPFAVASDRVVRPTSAQALPFAIYVQSAVSADLGGGTAAERAVPALALLAVLLELRPALLLLLHVGVEQLLVLCAQRAADLRLTPNLERLHLVTRGLVLGPQRTQPCRVALLAQRPRLLHRRLHRLAQRLAFRRVLRVDRLDARLFRV